MKNLKRVILTTLCLAVIFGTVACGNANDDGQNDAANNNNDVTEGTDNKDHTVDDNMSGNDTADNGTTDNGTTGNGTTNGDGNIVDDAGNAAGDVIDDIGNGVKDITDDVTGNNNNNNNANR